MSNYKINRRQFITSTGIVFTLPLLESLLPVRNAQAADAANDPKRWVLFYFPNGTYNLPDKPIWAVKPGAINAGNTSLAISPFASNYGEMININNLKLPINLDLPEDHSQQAAAYMTCAEHRSSSMISFDQVIADKTGKAALVLGSGINNYEGFIEQWGMSYRDNKVIMGTSNPGDLYRQLLKQVAPSAGQATPTPTPTIDNSKSILDAALADFGALNSKLSKSDKLKMDEFMTAVRTLEGRVSTTSPSAPVATGGACKQPTLDSKLDTNDNSAPAIYIPIFQAFNDMIKIAFACDLTRSVSIMVDQEATLRHFASAGNYVYQNGDIQGIGDAHMEIAHACGTDLGYNRCVTLGRVYMSMVIDLVEKLKSASDPSGSRILDNTIIQCGYGVNDGSHNVFNEQRPLMLLGGRNMLTGGMSYNFGGTTSQFKDLYFAIASKMKLGLSSFQGSSSPLKI